MNRNKIRVFVHLVWATHDRLPLLTEAMEQRVYLYIETVCNENGCELRAIGGMPDHIHLLVALSGKTALSDLIKNIKGGSSRFISSVLKPGGWFGWQGSYGAFSVSASHLPAVTAYIRNQKQHHAANTLRAEVETTGENETAD